MISEQYSIQTSLGNFNVYKESSFDYKGVYKNDFLKIGGRNYCIEYKWDKEKPDIVELQWIDTLQGGCELSNKPMRKENTVYLFDLSLTLLKRYVPVKKIELLDTSNFSCTLPGNKKGQLFLNYYMYLFHNATWYDSKLGAYPKDSLEKQRYEENKLNFTDPLKKPTVFDFKNIDLNHEFEPLFQSSSTWKEFVDCIYKQTKSDILCSKVYPWYMNAAISLTGELSLPSIWYIDADNRPIIPYEIVKTGGGKYKSITRKRRIYQENDELSPSEIRTLRYVGWN